MNSMDILKQLSDGISSLLSLIGILLFGYMLLMGMAHKAGTTKWCRIEQDRRTLQGKPNFRVLSGSDKFELPWKDSSLIQGGFKGLGIVAILLSYVAFMLIFLASLADASDVEITINAILPPIVALMTFPVSMGVFIVIIQAISSMHRYKLPKTPFLFPIVLSLALGVSSWLVIQLSAQQLALGLQIAMFLVVSIYLSYLDGVEEGIKAADIESRFPLVSVVTAQGTTLNQVRFYEKTDSDYQFIADDGANLILPSSHIIEIRYIPEKPNQNTLVSGLENKLNKLSHSGDLSGKSSPKEQAVDSGDSAPK